MGAGGSETFVALRTGHALVPGLIKWSEVRLQQQVARIPGDQGRSEENGDRMRQASVGSEGNP